MVDYVIGCGGRVALANHIRLRDFDYFVGTLKVQPLLD